MASLPSLLQHLRLVSPYASLVVALVAAAAAEAAGPVVEIVAIEGDLVTVRTDDGSTREYRAARELRVVTPSHHEIRLIDLRPGERVRMIAQERGDEAGTPTAHGIVVVQDAQPAALPREEGSPMIRQSQRDEELEIEVESADDGREIEVELEER